MHRILKTAGNIPRQIIKAAKESSLKLNKDTFPVGKKYKPLSPSTFRANFLPSTGKASAITKASILHGCNDPLPLMVTKLNNSYILDFDSQTEIMYGVDAINFLKKTRDFKYDTQVIFPKKSSGVAQVNGKNINLAESSGIIINAGTKAQIDTLDGYPMVVLSKKDYDWYERYSKNARDINIRNKFDELIYYNSHLYNGSFSPNALLPAKFLDESFLTNLGLDKNTSRNHLLYDIFDRKDSLSDEDRQTITFLKELLDKLHAKGLIETKEEGYVRAIRGYNSEYFAELLQKEGFNNEEIKTLIPVFKQARQVKMESAFVRKNSASDYPPAVLKKMKEQGILYDNKKDADTNVYWKYHCGNEQTLKQMLQQGGFSQEEQDLIIANWKKANNTGFDLSGLRFLDENVAVYNLNSKLNNWTSCKTDWVTNSTAIASSNGNTPFIGVSMVRHDGIKPETMAKIRGGQETLHKHPNLNEKRQTEVYLITNGAATIDIVDENNTLKTKLYKKGELVVIGPGISHRVNSVSGNYEHVVLQLPSAFQYGFGFKENVDLPPGCNLEEIEQNALNLLTKMQENGEI